MKLPARSGQSKAWQYLPQALFLLSILLSLVTTWHATGHYLDSDASSELVLAHQLAQEGGILSRDWYYSTELRILNTQLIYTPLFWIFDDWHMVRFCGAVILQGIMLLSYAFLLRQTGIGKRVFYLSAALLLLPVSTAYGRIVLYHSYYIPHISLSFVLLGLLMGFTKSVNWKKPGSWIRLGLLCLLSGIGGMGGVRQLMITHAPALVSVVVLCLLEDTQSEDTGRSAIFAPARLQQLLCSGMAAVCSMVGVKVNSIVLSKFYTYDKQVENLLGFLDGGDLDEVVYAYFHQFGFRRDVELLSLSGILSLGAVFAGGYCLYLGIRKIRGYQKKADIRRDLLQTFFVYYAIVMLAVFLLTGKNQPYYFPLYLTFCLTWAAPLLVLHWEELDKAIHLFHAKKLFAWAALAVLFVSGFANITFFNGSKLFDQVYDGLTFAEMDKKENMSGVIAFLTENDYEIGYATFWNANVVTEISNGQLRMNDIDCNEYTLETSFRDWLTSRKLRDERCDRHFLLLEKAERELFSKTDTIAFCSLVYEDERYCVYDVTDVEEFSRTLFEY